MSNRFPRRWRLRLICSASLIGILIAALQGFGQQPAAKPSRQPASAPDSNGQNTGAPSTKRPDDATAKAPDQSGTSKDRLFWMLPNFLTLENAANVPPLTTAQKFKVVTRESFDISVYPYVAFVAALSQADKSDRGYGQGWGAYGERVGAAFGDATIENYMTGAIFPSLLHEDPRYYQMGKGGFWRRAGYSASRIVITRTDTGAKQFNYSELIGSATAAGISNIYHPDTDRTISNTMTVWASQVAWDTFTVELKEFWPDIRRSVSRHKTKQN